MIFSINLGCSQNPLGLYVDIDGKVRFWETDANLNGNLEDTVLVKCGSQTIYEDLRNIKQIDLTLIEAPKERETMESFSDPGKINDTTRYIRGSHLGETYFYDFNISLASPVYLDTSNNNSSAEDKYSDIVRGDGLTDSVLHYVKLRLENYINQFYGTHEPYEAIDELRQEFSGYDSVVNKVAVYDYLVDRVVFFDYNKENQLIRVMSYYWNSGVEVDHILYDMTGNIIYFARESIGSLRRELYFSYDSTKRVDEVIERHSYTSSINTTPHAYPDIRWVKFTYDHGVISSKSTLLDDGNWLTCYYEIR